MSLKNEFPQGTFYQAQVIKQHLSLGKDGTPNFSLTCKLLGKLVNPKRPSAGVLTCPSIEVDILLQFPADEQRMQITQDTLMRLGFDSDNIDLLNPATPGCHSFVGKQVTVTPQHRVSNEQEVTYWNLRFPSDIQGKPVAAGAVNESPAARAYREMIKRRKEEANPHLAGQAAGAGAGSASSEASEEKIPF